MADNLTITLRADASKLRADLALAQAEVRNLGTELRKAASDSLATGDTTAIRGLADAFEGARGRVGALRKEIADATPHVNDLRDHFSGLGAEIRNLAATTFPTFSGAITAMGIPALIAGMAIGIEKLASAAADHVNKVNNEAVAIGISVKSMAAYREAFERTGKSGDEASAAIAHAAEAIGKVREEALKAGGAFGETANKVTTLKGGITTSTQGLAEMTSVLRGGVQPSYDLKNAILAVLGPEAVKSYGAGAAELDREIQDISKALSKIKQTDPALADLLGKEIFKRNYHEIAAALDEASKSFDEIKKRREALHLDPTPAEVAGAKGYVKQAAELGDQFERLRDESGAAQMDTLNKVKSFLADLIQSYRDVRREYKVSVSEGILTDTVTAAATIIGYWQSVTDKIAEAVNAAAKAAAQVLPPGVSSSGDQVGGTGFAGGGLVRGAGTGTSDSIWARLSDTEFVHQAAAVRYYGVDFMRQINAMKFPKFSLGGLVGALDMPMPEPPRFASGGLVEALAASPSGKSAFTIVLDGQHFQASSDHAVAESLERAAHRQSILSLGKKPSSYT